MTKTNPGIMPYLTRTPQLTPESWKLKVNAVTLSHKHLMFLAETWVYKTPSLI